MKRVLVLGSTGSIGSSTLNIIENMPQDFTVCGLSAHSNEDKLNQLSSKYKCPSLLTSKNNKEDDFNRLIDESKPDIVVNGIAGAAGLLPSKIVLENGIDLALANKETIVMAGPLIQVLAARNNAKILPVDSEHSAIFNLIEKMGKKNVSKVIITASGGPFRTFSKEQLQNITVEQALNHPTWKMGPKITIDSSTLANKGLEVIEAAFLFDLNIDQILNGDYTSLAGTWKNGRGQTFEFSDEGMLEGMNISSPRESSYGTVILACGAANGAPGGFAIEVYPTGVKNPKGDHSDSSQPRLIAGQQFIDFPAEAYYYRE